MNGLTNIFHWVIVVDKFHFDSDCACLDFEKLFTNASKDKFPGALIVGYCFVGSNQCAGARQVCT